MLYWTLSYPAILATLTGPEGGYRLPNWLRNAAIAQFDMTELGSVQDSTPCLNTLAQWLGSTEIERERNIYFEQAQCAPQVGVGSRDGQDPRLHGLNRQSHRSQFVSSTVAPFETQHYLCYRHCFARQRKAQDGDLTLHVGQAPHIVVIFFCSLKTC